MRFYEFIVEYKTDITKGNYGQKILDKLQIQNVIDLMPEIEAGKPMTMKPNDYQRLALEIMGVKGFIDMGGSFGFDGGPGTGYQSPWRSIDQKLYDENKNKIVDEMLKVFESFDPTTNKQYTQYIVKWYLIDQKMTFPNIEDGRSTLKQAFDDFYRMKERLPEQYRGMDQYKFAKEFVDSVQYFNEKYGKKVKLPEGKSKLIYNSKYGKTYWAVDEEGSCYLGQGTQWCTASTRSANYFDEYDAKGPLLIFQMTKPVKYNLRDDYEDDGGHFHAEYAEETNKFQVSLQVGLDFVWRFSAGDIAAPDDEEIYFSDLYDYNSHFKAMYDSQEFQNAMTNVAKEWAKTSLKHINMSIAGVDVDDEEYDFM